MFTRVYIVIEHWITYLNLPPVLFFLSIVLCPVSFLCISADIWSIPCIVFELCTLPFMIKITNAGSVIGWVGHHPNKITLQIVTMQIFSLLTRKLYHNQMYPLPWTEMIIWFRLQNIAFTYIYAISIMASWSIKSNRPGFPYDNDLHNMLSFLLFSQEWNIFMMSTKWLCTRNRPEKW
jgi:hypothetical protein